MCFLSCRNRLLDTFRRSTGKHQSLTAEQLKIDKDKTERKKARNTYLMRFDNCLRHRAEGERYLINQSLQVTNTGDNTSLYIARESTKEKKSTDLNWIRNGSEIQIGKRSEPSCSRPGGQLIPLKAQVYTLAGRPGGRPLSLQAQVCALAGRLGDRPLVVQSQKSCSG